MEIDDFPALPENSCAYERYDPRTLEPLTIETAIRLQELGWSAKDFSGKTVLDIGCNSGLLTMYALRLGALKVHACDVQPPLVEFVSQVVASRGAPVTVTRTALKDLQPEKDKADIVLFMEVLHWAVSQGLILRDVIRHLASLTGEVLYLEFPWSIREPSIQKQTKLTEELYSAEASLDELTRYFRQVRVVRFMHYFGFESRSVRVLIEARDKRPEADFLSHLPKVYSLDLALSRGQNESYLLTSARGPLVAKLLAPQCPLAQIPESLVNQLFAELSSQQPRTVVLPEKIQDSYCVTLPGNKRWMIFRFLGRLPSAGRMIPAGDDLGVLVDLFIEVRRDLRQVSPNLLSALRQQRLSVDVSAVVSAEAEWATDGSHLAPIRAALLETVRILQDLDLKLLDSLCHSDLQTGNFVLDDEKRLRVVDIDTLCLGSVYSDGLIGLIWRGGSEGTMKAFTERLCPEETRAVSRFDIAWAVAIGLMWYSAARRAGAKPNFQLQITRVSKGLEQAMALAASLPS